MSRNKNNVQVSRKWPQIINSSFSSFLFVRYKRQQDIKTEPLHFTKLSVVEAPWRNPCPGTYAALSFLIQHVLQKPHLFSDNSSNSNYVEHFFILTKKKFLKMWYKHRKQLSSQNKLNERTIYKENTSRSKLLWNLPYFL